MAAVDTKDPVVKAIVKSRKDGSKWAEIAEANSMTVGKAIFLHECATVEESDLIDPEASAATLQKAIVRMRDKHSMSWGQISARLGRGAIGEIKARSIYFGNGGEIDNVLRGGRRAGEKAAPVKEKAAKAPAKKAPAKKAAAKKTPANVSEMTADELVKAMVNKFVHTTDGDKLKAVMVAESNGMFEITDADGDEWGLEQGDIAKITAR